MFSLQGRAGVVEEDRMKREMRVIMRRLADVPAVKGDVGASLDRSRGGPGVSRYQKQSAHLRDRDCSVGLTDFDIVSVDLTKD